MTFNNSQTPAPPDNNHKISHIENEIDLLDLFRPLWQQKVMITIITFVVIAIAAILTLLTTPKYKIYTQLKAGTYRWDKEGTPVPYMKTNDLKNLLSGGIFDTYTEQAGLKDNVPKITITDTRKGEQLTATIFWPDPAQGKKILSGYIKFLNQNDRNNNDDHTSGLQNQRNSLQKLIMETRGKIASKNLKQQTIALNIEQKKEELKLVDLKVDQLERDIERINADLSMTKKEVNFLDERIKVAVETRIGYEKSRQEIDTNTTRIISLRDKLLQTPPDDSLQLLLLASTIQQNIAYLSTIDQKIEAARKEVISYRTTIAGRKKMQEKHRLSIADLQARITSEIPKQKSDLAKEITKLQWRIDRELSNEIALLQQRIEGLNERIKIISLVETIECPQASTKPVKPNKTKIVALAGVMGGFFGILCAYSRHFWLTNRERLTNKG